MTGWWVGAPDAATAIECAGETHTLRWHDGGLRAVDHPDPEGERALAALAGEPVHCLELLGAWERHASDLSALVLGSRGGSDTFQGDGSQSRPRRQTGRATGSMVTGRSGTGGAFSGRAGGQTVLRGGPAAHGTGGEGGLEQLLMLGGGLGERLQATVAAGWLARLQTGEAAALAARPTLHAALYGRLALALREFLERPELALELELVHADEPRSLALDGDTARARLPLSWLTEVWGRGLTTGFGRLCLAARSEDGAHWALDTVGPGLGPMTTITLALA